MSQGELQAGVRQQQDFSTEDQKLAKAKIVIRRRFGVEPSEQEWQPCGHDEVYCEFLCRRSNKLYIARLIASKNVLRIYCHSRCVNLQ